MNIEEYKKAMIEVSVDTDKIKSRFEKEINEKVKGKKVNILILYKRPIFICILSAVLVFTFSNLDRLNGGPVSNYTLTVYASSLDKEFVLSDEPITLSNSNQFNLQAISNKGENNETGSVNFDLNFKCEGRNIKNITYKLSDKIITRDNRGEAVAWFAENIQYNTVLNLKQDNDKSVYRILSSNQKSTYFVTKMIGNFYCVDYENQNDKHYSLEINLSKDDKGKLTAKEFTITVILTLDDGTTLEKHILVTPLIANTLDYGVSKIEMTLEQ